MRPRPRLFLDTSVLFAALLSAGGGARLLLKLGESGLLQVVLGPRVLAELDGVVRRKAPDLRPTVALLLDAAGCEIGPAPDAAQRSEAGRLLSYAPDAQIVAEALAADVDYLVSLDREHLVDNRDMDALPFPVGTPGDCLGWLRSAGGPLVDARLN